MIADFIHSVTSTADRSQLNQNPDLHQSDLSDPSPYRVGRQYPLPDWLHQRA